MGCCCRCTKLIVIVIFFWIGCSLLALGCILGFLLFPDIINDEITKNVILENGTLQWERFETIPFPINFKVHFFTIVNPEETLTGETPIVQEEGPYFYTETRVKNIISAERDVVHYEEIWQFQFNAAASGEKTEEDVINVINAPLLGIIQNLEELPIALPQDLDVILSDIFEDTGIFISVTVKDYAFGGIKMCDPARTTTGYSMLICLAIMLMKLKLIKYNEDRSMLFSLFGYKTNPDGPFALRRGIDQLDKLGLITAYKGLQYTNYWNGYKSACDKVEGHYTTFPPFMKKDTQYQVYSTDICKGGIVKYVDTTNFKGVDGYRFTTNEFSFASPELECVCIDATKGLDGQTNCFSEGVLDLNTCLGAPVILSFPHLMWAGDKYKNSIIGLNSEYDDSHNTIIDFEPHLGFPLRGAIRIQFNIVLRPVNYAGAPTEATKNLPGALFPIIWLEDSFELTDALIDEINTDLISKLSLVEGAKWGMIGVGSGVIVLTTVFFICMQTRKR